MLPLRPKTELRKGEQLLRVSRCAAICSTTAQGAEETEVCPQNQGGAQVQLSRDLENSGMWRWLGHVAYKTGSPMISLNPHSGSAPHGRYL